MSLTPRELGAMRWDWRFWARPQQLAPEGDWSIWVALAGRGFGKTRLGAEWIRDMVCGATPMTGGRYGRIALVAETAADARDVMVQGQSGILAVHPPDQRPTYTKSLRKLEWPNGAIAHTYSAEDPEQLRGPEHDLAWSDELAKWRYAQETWDMLQFGMRVGEAPRQLVTTTPRPIPIVRELLSRDRNVVEDGDVATTRGSTYDNLANLAAPFIKAIRRRYEGTRLGRQEIAAEVLDDIPGALWTRRMLDRRTDDNPHGAGMGPRERLPDMRRIAIGVDPSGSNGEEESADDIGIVAAGEGVDGQYYILQDASCSLGPAGWARRVAQTYKRLDADVVVGEANYGGAMVEFTIRTVDRKINYQSVHATRGKVVRAEPIAALYEQGRVRHYGESVERDERVKYEDSVDRSSSYGSLDELEDQMCSMTSRGYEGSGSPDRVDAAVWALTELAFGRSNRGGQRAVRGHI